ncbi:MAG: hypothetical protein IPH05_16140 [Flavobacteriales bacterium]|jgi:hypothetical protein|nr:hypothetical protein [Flavobacteriales bacterium]MBK6548970.1 hypothetical protein [Flavobacteriales bacterium]MBK6884438.1 hypothetical protein [Flavobacteriales bacterium]MBK7100833.1 hypothetical protein [Flavobacteriales bacterium]MBK7111520.1 hypothetical protein [Flavobacteriales bacterium]
MKYRLANLEGLTLKQLESEVALGGKLVTYVYTISPIAFTIRNVTAVYLVQTGKKDKHWIAPTIVTGLFGWWSVPNGFINALRSIKVNTSGGLDVTGDVMANLDETSLLEKTVELQVVQSLFGKASERNRTLITKAVNLSIPHYREIEEVYLGLFINTQEGEQPFHVIGVKSNEPIDRFSDSLMMNLRKDYYKHVRFDIIALDSSEVSTKLIEQGVRLKTMNS